jgi:drug/metabolite transporter (DMT)-like permease
LNLAPFGIEGEPAQFLRSPLASSVHTAVTPTIAGIVLCAAALHAGWNAALRGGGDRLRTVALMSLVTTAVAVPAAIILPLPASPSWPYVGLSAVLQGCYSIVLIQAYRLGELGQVYPIIRGSVPILVTAGGRVVLRQQPSPLSLLGVGLVAAGTLSLAGDGRWVNARAAFPAVITGLIVASYVTMDGLGVRRAGDVGGYAAWIFLAYGVAMPLLFGGLRGRRAMTIGSEAWLRAGGAGIGSVLAYVAVLYALAHAPAGPVAAVRESSVIFAALIGRAALGEALARRRLIACTVVALGAALVGSGL